MDFNHNEAYSLLTKVDPSLYNHNQENAFISIKKEIEETHEIHSDQSDAHDNKEDLQSQLCQNIPLTVTSPDDDNDSGTESVCSGVSEKSNGNQTNKKRPGRKKGQGKGKVNHF